ncbi:hypothetical protein NQ317_006513 [Molorchus minor]|uniref:Uncharacterized protein n=1 Tax=Molorchus minor TaxID=1323400 RepID=A0ABQ9JL48_9CUCU|nr:hypothetical protein NQ317_006513 [Molorchus minor]
MLFDRLDHDTATRFEFECGPSLEVPDNVNKMFQILTEFLNKQCLALDTVSQSNNKVKASEKPHTKAKPSSSRSSCKTCSRKHHTLLHFEAPLRNVMSPPTESTLPPAPMPTSSDVAAGSTNLLSNLTDTVLLSTALIDVKDSWGSFQTSKTIKKYDVPESFQHFHKFPKVSEIFTTFECFRNLTSLQTMFATIDPETCL